jgi:hypothetical protein
MFSNQFSKIKQSDVTVYTKLKLALIFHTCPEGVSELQTIQIRALKEPMMAFDSAITLFF